jgi:hypothetical protein
MRYRHLTCSLQNSIMPTEPENLLRIVLKYIRARLTI